MSGQRGDVAPDPANVVARGGACVAFALVCG